MATNNAASDVPKLSNDDLAVRLIQCATMVKKGEKGQLIRDTIYDLTYYLTGKVPNANGRQSVSHVTEGFGEQTSAKTDLVQTPSGQPSLNGEADLPGPVNREESLGKNRNSPLKQVLGPVIRNDVSERPEQTAAHARNESASSRSTNGSSYSQPVSQNPSVRHRPAFHRPANPNSPLIANGWIEQYRRSKMLRTVWKVVLASLVEARRPGEETTFWVQRETTTVNNGKPELEALHQIPVKWIKEVKYDEYASDYRFSLRVANVNDEFVFRCPGSEEATQNWVLTLRSAIETAIRTSASSSGKAAVSSGRDDWDVAPTRQLSYEDEKKLPEHQSHSQHSRSQPSANQIQQSTSVPPVQQQQIAQVPVVPQRMSVKELRAIAHGAGIMTHGMERRDLERVVQDIFRVSHVNPPPSPADDVVGTKSEPATAAPPFVPAFAVRPEGPILASVSTSSDEEDRRRLLNEATKAMNGDPNSDIRRAAEDKQQEEHRRLVAERVKQQQEEEQRRQMAERTKQQQEEEHQRLLAERIRQQQDAERRMKEEEERKRLEQERLRKEEEAHQKRVADLQAAAERQRQEEQQRKQQMQWQQQQQEWQKQQAEQERRRQEEAFRARQQQQQWQQQQQQASQQQSTGSTQPPQWNRSSHPHPGAPNFGPAPNIQQPFPPGPQQFPTGQNPFPHASAPNSGSGSAFMSANMKYAKMAQQTEDDSQATFHAIKHGVLLQWALCPPTMQVLKPIQFLLAEMPLVFPPKFNVATHDHFSKWSPMRPEDVCVGPGRPDPEKLNKTMRKLRLFLHPDKLPRDFTKEQEHLCKLLWDITSDAYEDFKKSQEDLGWIRS